MTEKQKHLQLTTAEIKQNGGLTCLIEPDADALAGMQGLPPGIRGLKITAVLSVGSASILAEGEFNGEITRNCDRCLSEFIFKFTGSFDETYQEAVECIDMSEPVRQALLLAMPVKNLCSENCRGLCPSCGCDMNKSDCSCKREPPGLFSILKKL